MHRARSSLPYALFILSGFAALVLETVFLRELVWLFGSSAVASAVVLAAFMAGLALGAVAFGRLADRVASPLRLFGLLELGTAASGAGLVWLLGSGRQLVLAPFRLIEAGGTQRTLEIGLAFGLVLLPTVLMGGTLPALSRSVVRGMSTFAGSLGVLYGANTLGAAAGVFVAGFYLFELVGVSASGYVAAMLQASVGLAAIAVSRAEGPSRAPAIFTAAGASDPRARKACLFAATASGLAVLGYEVVWTRLLTLCLRSYAYSFSLMLSLFLVGLCGGGILLAWVSRRVTSEARLIGILQLAMGVYVAASVLWLPGALAPVSAASFSEFVARAAMRTAPIVLPPTLLSGMLLPLAARGFAAGMGRVGADVGRIYACNTLGAIAGALGAGLLLLPALGAPRSLVVLAGINALAGASVLALIGCKPRAVALAVALAAACFIPLFRGTERFVTAFLGASPARSSLGSLLFFDEGATDTVAIVERSYGFHDPQAKSLITNGFAMTATVKPVWRYMAAEGHLPVLFSAGPRRALAVGVGTGITLSAIVAHPAIESIVAVELSEGVLGGLEQFRDENAGAFADPRVRLIHDDGRHWLELTEERFDVITVEPPPPIVAGSVHLYSLDFYALCSRRLTHGGVIAQWLPLHAQSLASARMTARTFLEAYPHVMLWLPSARDAVLLGSHEPLRLTLSRLEAAYSTPDVRESLERAYLESSEALLATFLLDREALGRWAGAAPVISDEHPLMEFFGRAANMDDAEIASLLEIEPAPFDWLEGMDEAYRRRLEQERAAFRAYLESVAKSDPRAGVLAARSSRATEFLLYPHGCTAAQRERLLRGEHELAPDRLAQQLEKCARLLDAERTAD